jgi:hypothetical protein
VIFVISDLLLDGRYRVGAHDQLVRLGRDDQHGLFARVARAAQLSAADRPRQLTALSLLVRARDLD